jgi:hypothetical protein
MLGDDVDSHQQQLGVDLAESELLDSFAVDFGLGASLSMDNLDRVASLDSDAAEVSKQTSAWGVGKLRRR